MDPPQRSRGSCIKCSWQQSVFLPWYLADDGGTEPRKKDIPLSALHVHSCAVFLLKVRDSWNC